MKITVATVNNNKLQLTTAVLNAIDKNLKSVEICKYLVVDNSMDYFNCMSKQEFLILKTMADTLFLKNAKMTMCSYAMMTSSII